VRTAPSEHTAPGGPVRRGERGPRAGRAR